MGMRRVLHNKGQSAMDPRDYDTDAHEIWARVRGLVRSEVGEAAFRSWLKPLTFMGNKNGAARLAVPTRFMRDWVRSNYAARIAELWEEVSGRDYQDRDRGPPPPARPKPKPEPRADRGPASESRSRRRQERRAGGKPRAACSAASPRRPGAKSAHRSTRVLLSRISSSASPTSWPMPPPAGSPRRATVPFNPLFLYGGVGLGKTHLMHAIAWNISERSPERAVIYLSAEKFMYEFIRALRKTKDTMSFKEQFRSVDVLMIDDVQFIGGQATRPRRSSSTPSTPWWIRTGRWSSPPTSRPSDLEGVEERMRSRLGWGLVADIHPTTYELRLGILQTKAETAEALGIEIPGKVLEFLAHKITSNVRELEGALNRIVAHADPGRPPDRPWRPPRRPCTTCCAPTTGGSPSRRSKKKVSEHFNIRLADMHSPRRARAVAGRGRSPCTWPSS